MSEVLCFSGVSGSGKTTAIQKMVKESYCRKIAGFITIGDYKNGQRHSFWIRDVVTNRSILLAQRNLPARITQGAFGFTPEGLQFGNSCLRDVEQVEVLFIDEVGPLELRGEGWYPSLQKIMTTEIAKIVFTSRPTTVTQICDTFFPDKNVEIIEVNRM